MKNFKEVYNFPFENTQWDWVYDSGGENFIFQWQIENIEKQNLLLSVINGNENLKNPFLNFTHKEGVIYDGNGNEIIMIRGWGNLTSTNCFGFSPKEAANIQDTLAEYIIERLNYRE